MLTWLLLDKYNIVNEKRGVTFSLWWKYRERFLLRGRLLFPAEKKQYFNSFMSFLFLNIQTPVAQKNGIKTKEDILVILAHTSRQLNFQYSLLFPQHLIAGGFTPDPWEPVKSLAHLHFPRQPLKELSGLALALQWFFLIIFIWWYVLVHYIATKNSWQNILWLKQWLFENSVGKEISLTEIHDSFHSLFQFPPTSRGMLSPNRKGKWWGAKCVLISTAAE